MTQSNSPEGFVARLQNAIALIAATPGYREIGDDLARLLTCGKLEFVPTLEDRGQATLGGRLLVGPEAIYSSPISLAETLVHEHWHLRRQPPLEKTASFWVGVVTGKPVMRRYEIPAYQSALDFLSAVQRAFPAFAEEARAEQESIHASFDTLYGGPLTG